MRGSALAAWEARFLGPQEKPLAIAAAVTVAADTSKGALRVKLWCAGEVQPIAQVLNPVPGDRLLACGPLHQ